MEDRVKQEGNQKGYFQTLRGRCMGDHEKDIHTFGVEALLAGVGWGIVSFFLGICRLPFSVYPLGMAILCASDTYVGFSLAGLIIASFFLPTPIWVSLSILALTLAVRILTRLFVDIPVRSREVVGIRGIAEHIHGRLFCESVYLRMTCSCVAVFALSLYAIFSGGFRYYDVFGAFFSMAVAPTATFFYCSLLGDMPMRTAWLFRIRCISKSVLAFSLCLSFGGLDISGVSLGVAAAFAGTLILCRTEGLPIGALTGLLCGISCGGTYFAIFPVVAIVSFCLFEFSPYLSAFVSCVIGCIAGVLLVGREELLAVFLPLLLGTSLYCTFEKLFWQKGISGMLRQRRKNPECDLKLLEEKNAEICSAIWDGGQSLRVLSELFTSLSETKQELLCSEKTRVFAEGYRATADMFLEFLEDTKGRYREDEKKTIAIRDKLREIGFSVEQVRVCGDEDIRIFASGVSPVPEYKRLVYLQKQLGRTLDCMLALPKVEMVGEACLLMAERAISYEAECGIAQTAKESESGDFVCTFEAANRKRFYTLINDGMGSGKEAALTAGVSAEILQRLLGAGVGIEKSLRMLNSFLALGRNGGETESSTTVDLFCLDKLTGHAVFLKSGAAPSYVKRGTNIFKLNGTSLPVGILTAIDAKQIGFDTCDGDIVVQVSDGVTGEEEECLWLLDYLNSTEECEPEAMAEQIKQAAIANGSQDDVSVAVTKIRQKN